MQIAYQLQEAPETTRRLECGDLSLEAAIRNEPVLPAFIPAGDAQRLSAMSRA